MSYKTCKVWISTNEKLEDSVSGALSKVLELSKPNNFVFDKFWSWVEEIGEKLNGNSQIQNKTEFQNLPKNPQYSEACIYRSVEFWTKLQMWKLYHLVSSTSFLLAKIKV